MSNIKLDLEKSGLKKEEIMKYRDKVAEIHNELYEKSDDEKEFVGWLKLPTNYDKEEFERIKKCAERIKENSDIFLVIGIGGSYLGARAVIEALTNTFYNMLPNRKTPQILFVGNNMSPNYLNDLIELIGNKDLSINVISKSGTTTEPAMAFRIFREFMENKYGIDEARKRIYVTTDKEKGALKKLATEEEYETFVIPDNVGGRYSVLTAVGLLPIAVSGVNIDELMKGARKAQNKYCESDLKYNECYQYAVARNILYKNKKMIELLVSYEPKMQFISEWWKQLYGESEGKEGKGIFPASVMFTTVNIENTATDITIKKDADNVDGLNFLADKTMSYVCKKAMEGTIEAHVSGNVPNILINMNNLDEENLGELIYFFELACAMSGRILGVNPFNQPGVEAYKHNMFKLLGKFE